MPIRLVASNILDLNFGKSSLEIDLKSLIILFRLANKPGVFRSSNKGDINSSEESFILDTSTSSISASILYNLSRSFFA